MAVICKNKNGAFIDHLRYINTVYSQPLASGQLVDTNTSQTLQLNPDLFNINTMFMMDSQFEKLRKQLIGDEWHQFTKEQIECDGQSQRRKKNKKKRKYDEMSEGEQNAVDYHNHVVDIIRLALEQLKSLASDHGYLRSSSVQSRDNNVCARNAAVMAEHCPNFVELCQKAADLGTIAEEEMDIDKIKDDMSLVNRLIHHHGNQVLTKKIMDSVYILPPKCSFLMSDLSCLEPLLRAGVQYDLIVLDPPWYNKSVRRKSSYRALYDEDLLQIPLPLLAKPQCLVVVWATNNQQQQKFIKQQLFPKWHVHYLAIWFWLKVTKDGLPVVDLHSSHKNPYETLFIGRVQEDHDSNSEKMTVQTDDVADRTESRRCEDVPNDYVLISVPSSVHSHKPPLSEVLQPFLPAQPKCLEMFARCLLPGWTSWGNEVLKLQHRAYFVSSKCE